MAIPKSPNGEMPFLDHLEELRWRIIYALGAVLIGVGIGFFLAVRYDVVGWLARPIMYLLPEKKLVFTHPSEGFTIILDVAVTFGLVVASPIVITQVWAFLVPALKPQEKRVGLVVLFSGILLFVGGAALAYFVVVPLAIPWLFEFGGPSLIPLITAEEYFSFLFEMVLTFGLSFELPIVILALAALGIVTPQFLHRYRRHAIVLIIVVGAFLTPGDLVWTTIALAVPLYALYELSVLGAVWVYRSKQRRLARREAEAAAEAARAGAGSADVGVTVPDDERDGPRSLVDEDERTDR